MGRLDRQFDSIADSRIYRRLIRRRYTGCDRCPPHGGMDNTSYRGQYPVKKAFQRDAKRRHRLP